MGDSEGVVNFPMTDSSNPGAHFSSSRDSFRSEGSGLDARSGRRAWNPGPTRISPSVPARFTLTDQLKGGRGMKKREVTGETNNFEGDEMLDDDVLMRVICHKQGHKYC